MAKESNSSFKISIADGTIEVSGSENFVKKQIKEWKEYIEDMLETSIQAFEVDDEYYDDIDDDFYEEDFDINDFDDALFIEDIGDEDEADQELSADDVIISGEIPGENTTEKTQNAALLYAYARLMQGSKDAEVAEVRKICDMQGFLDTNNFSTYIKGKAGEWYKDNGKGKNRKLKLTKKGIAEAEKLIESVNQV